jgi:hypothetical protein
MFRGDDTVGRFVSAIEDNEDFRQAIAFGDEATIKTALSSAGIELTPDYAQQFVNACLALRKANAWGSLDDLRRALIQLTFGSAG